MCVCCVVGFVCCATGQHNRSNQHTADDAVAGLRGWRGFMPGSVAPAWPCLRFAHSARSTHAELPGPTLEPVSATFVERFVVMRDTVRASPDSAINPAGTLSGPRTPPRRASCRGYATGGAHKAYGQGVNVQFAATNDTRLISAFLAGVACCWQCLFRAGVRR